MTLASEAKNNVEEVAQLTNGLSNEFRHTCLKRKTIIDQLSTQAVTLSSQGDAVMQSVQKMSQDIINEKHTSEQRHASTQG